MRPRSQLDRVSPSLLRIFIGCVAPSGTALQQPA